MYCVCVPVIVQVPAPLVNVKPVAIAPLVIANETASVQVNVCVEIAALPLNVPIDPAAGDTHAGASETVSNAEELLTAFPSLFSILKKYVPSTGKVNVATT